MANVYHIGGFFAMPEDTPSIVKGMNAFVAYKDPIPTKVSRLGGFMLVTEVELPKNIGGKDAVERMILRRSLIEIPIGALTIGPPEVTDQYNRNTRVLVSWPENTEYKGSGYFYYNRVGVGEMKIPNTFTLQGETTAQQLVPRLREVTEVLVDEGDFDEVPSTNGVVLRGSVDSYFFIPGSEIIFGGSESPEEV